MGIKNYIDEKGAWSESTVNSGSELVIPPNLSKWSGVLSASHVTLADGSSAFTTGPNIVLSTDNGVLTVSGSTSISGSFTSSSIPNLPFIGPENGQASFFVNFQDFVDQDPNIKDLLIVGQIRTGGTAGGSGQASFLYLGHEQDPTGTLLNSIDFGKTSTDGKKNYFGAYFQHPAAGGGGGTGLDGNVGFFRIMQVCNFFTAEPLHTQFQITIHDIKNPEGPWNVSGLAFSAQGTFNGTSFADSLLTVQKFSGIWRGIEDQPADRKRIATFFIGPNAGNSGPFTTSSYVRLYGKS